MDELFDCYALEILGWLRLARYIPKPVMYVMHVLVM